jgi:hypothetical protein
VILLDTNVISALMQREVDPAVVTWLDSQPPESIWTTSITVFEVRFGLEILASGRRRRSLEEAFQKLWKRISKDVSFRSTKPPRRLRDKSLLSEGDPVALSRSGTCRLRGSQLRVKRHSRRAMSVTSETLVSN